MRVRYLVFNAYAMGGTTRSVVNQANALCERHDVEIASVYRNRDAPVFAVDPRVRLVPLTDLRSDGSRRDGASRPARSLRRLPTPLVHRRDRRFLRWDPVVEAATVRYLRADRDAVLVTTRPGLNLLSSRFAPRGVVRVAQDHMNLASYRPGLRAAVVRAYPRLDAVTVLTERDRVDYERAFAGSDVPVVCIPNGVPEPALPPAPLEAPVVLAAGRLFPQKGFDLLLDAFAAVAGRHPAWELRIFGAGEQRDALAAQVDSLGLGGRVHLRRAVHRLDRELVRGSVYVLSSRFEGFPMVLLEAMSLGLPAVAFDCPTGPAEIVRDDVSGLLVPPGDVPGLAAAMDRLMADADLRRSMGRAAREDARQWSASSLAPEWEALFARLVGSR